MKIDKKYIESEIREISKNSGFLLIDFILRGDKNQQVFEVFIDNEKGITSEDCAELSRKIHDFLDPLDEVSANYRLDVSSPGVNRPIKFIQQFPKHLNRKFDLKFVQGGQTKKMNAELVGIEGAELTFKKGEEIFVIPFDNIKSAKVLISF